MTKSKSIRKSQSKAKTPTSRLQETAKELRKITEEIAPFVRVRKFTEYTTAGQWRVSSPTEVAYPSDDDPQLAF